MKGQATKRQGKVSNSEDMSVPSDAPVFLTKPALWKVAVWFAILVAVLMVLEIFVPLGSATKLGADEDFELSKTMLCLKGYHFYTEVWNDEPPLYPFVLTHIVGNESPAVFGARLLTTGFTVVLLGALFCSACASTACPWRCWPACC